MLRLRLVKDGVLIYRKNIPDKLIKYIERRGKRNIIHRLAAIYLVDKNIVINDVKLLQYFDMDRLIKKFSKYDPYILPKYLIYRDLMDRGYVVVDGYGKGIDLLVYDRGDFPNNPPSIRVIGVEEGDKISIGRLLNEVYLGNLNKKKIIIAVIERRGEIVYYKLNDFKVESINEEK